MLKKSILSLLVMVLLIGGVALPASAQGRLTPENVSITAEDGLELVGHYYAPPEGETLAPAVLLMHHAGSRKESWTDFVVVLHEAGYAVLSIDIRGYGDSGRETDFVLAEQDTVLWLDWLQTKENVDPEKINIVGSSIGGDLALRVMVFDTRIDTITVLSPGLSFQDVFTAEAVEQIDRPMFFVTGADDEFGMEAFETFMPLITGDSMFRTYPTDACCTFLFMLGDDLQTLVINWLDTYNR